MGDPREQLKQGSDKVQAAAEDVKDADVVDTITANQIELAAKKSQEETNIKDMHTFARKREKGRVTYEVLKSDARAKMRTRAEDLLGHKANYEAIEEDWKKLEEDYWFSKLCDESQGRIFENRLGSKEIKHLPSIDFDKELKEETNWFKIKDGKIDPKATTEFATEDLEEKVRAIEATQIESDKKAVEASPTDKQKTPPVASKPDSSTETTTDQSKEPTPETEPAADDILGRISYELNKMAKDSQFWTFVVAVLGGSKGISELVSDYTNKEGSVINKGWIWMNKRKINKFFTEKYGIKLDKSKSKAFLKRKVGFVLKLSTPPYDIPQNDFEHFQFDLKKHSDQKDRRRTLGSFMAEAVNNKGTDEWKVSDKDA